MSITRIAAVLALAVLPLCAQPGPGPRGPRHPMGERMLERMGERLKLTDDQKARIKAIHVKHREAHEAKLKAAMEAHKAFHEAMKNPATPAAQLKTLHQAMADHTFEQMMDRRALHEEVQTVLTPEQRAEAEKMRAFRKGFQAGHRGRRGEFGPRF